MAEIDLELVADLKKATAEIAKFSQQSAESLGKISDSFTKLGEEGSEAADEASDSFRGFGSTLSGVGGSLVVFNQGLELTGKIFSFLGDVVAATVGEFADFESALVGVEKTTNISGKDLQDLGDSFKNLSESIPVSATELARIGEAAGQLGVPGEEILNFTETIARLGTATNLTSEEAATSLARILTVSNETTGNIDELGSAIVALGNNFAATEQEIVKVTNEIARGAGVFGVASFESAALATTLRSLGVRAELAGSVVTRTFIAINDAIQQGGTQLESLRQITGKTAEELEKAFSENAVGVFQDFIEGVGRLGGPDGEKVNQVLSEFGLKGTEVAKTLPPLINNTELFEKALGLARAEVENSNALLDESARAYETLAARSSLLTNAISNVSSEIGGAFAPALAEGADFLAELISEFRNSDAFEEFTASLEAIVTDGMEGIIDAIPTMIRGLGLVIQTFQGVKLGVELAQLGFQELVLTGVQAINGLVSAFTRVGAAFANLVVAPIAAITGALNDLGLASDSEAANFAKLSDSLSNVVSNGVDPFAAAIADSEAKVKDARLEVGKTSLAINDSSVSFETAALSAEKAAGSAKVLAAERAKSKTATTEATAAENEQVDALTSAAKSQESLNSAQETGLKTTKAATGGAKANSKALKDTEKALKKLNQELLKSQAADDPLAALEKVNAERTKVIQDALAKSIIDTTEAERLKSQIALDFTKQTEEAKQKILEDSIKEQKAAFKAGLEDPLGAASLGEAAGGPNFVDEDTSQLIGQIGGLAKAVSQGAKGAEKLITQFGATFADTILPGLGQVAGPLLDVFTQGPEATKAFVEEFAAAIPQVINSLVESLPAFIIAIADALPEIITGLSESLPRIIEVLAANAPEIAVALAKAMPQVAIALGKAILGLDLARALGESISNEFDLDLDFAPKIEEFTNGVSDSLTEKLVATFDDPLAAFDTTVRDAAEGVDTSFTSASNSITEAGFSFKGSAFEARESIKSAGTSFKNSAAQAAESFKAAGNSIANAFKKVTETLLTIPSIFSGIGTDLTASLSSAGSAFVTQLSKLPEDLRKSFLDIFSKLKLTLPEFKFPELPKFSFPRFRFPPFPRFKFPSLPAFKFPAAPTLNFKIEIPPIKIDIPGLGGGGGGGGGGVVNNVKKAFGLASGGLIPAGFPDDSFPALLSSGERVIRDDVNQRLEDFLDSQGDGGGGGGPTTIVLQIGEKQLADVLVNLDRQGFRTTA